MIAVLLSFLVGACAGSVATYFFLRNNAKKAAVINSTVNKIGAAADTVASTVKKL